MIQLAERKQTRRSEFSVERPTQWQPGQVRNPNGILDQYFTDTSAWAYIVELLKQNHPMEVVQLDKPPNSKGYVMKVDIEPDKPQLYIKLQLGSGTIFGRSFHYSNSLKNRGSNE